MKIIHKSSINNQEFRFIVLAVFFCLITCVTNAQSWSVSKTSEKMMDEAVVYIESTYQRPGASVGTKDTLTGTAFLVADSAKVYLVTAKHLMVAALIGKNQQLANNSILINASYVNNDKGIKLLGLSDRNIHKRPFILSSDRLDIAIISFQKNKYKKILAAILKKGRKPVSIDSIDTSNDHYPGESIFQSAYLTFKNPAGKRTSMQGLAPGKIKTYNKTQPSFTIDKFINQGNNGSPVFLNGKIIGILSNETGILTNADIIADPYRRAKSATIIKAAYILPLLRKLQLNENSPGFN